MDNRAAQNAFRDSTHSGVNAADLVDSESAISWAGRFVQVDDIKQISNAPWARTWRINHSQGRSYLKAIPSALFIATHTVPLLAARFPEHIPAVEATDPERGLILLADHGGRDLQRKPDESDRTLLLKTYARIQAQCKYENVADSDLSDLLLQPDPANLLDDLLRFLTPDGDLPSLPGAKVHADCFLSAAQCKAYASLIMHRVQTISARLKHANALPLTISHGDLRASNAARIGKRQMVLYDWDEAVAGPAGMSLHGLFSGCSLLYEVLGEGDALCNPEELRQPRRELSAYMQTLVEEDYADIDSLHKHLADGALAGMLNYIVGFSRFPEDRPNHSEAIKRNLKNRLSDLLDVCDYLCINDGSDVLSSSAHYIEHKRLWRAERLLEMHVKHHPLDSDAYTQLGFVRLQRHRDLLAINAFRSSLEISPEGPDVCRALGGCFARRGDYKSAERYLRRSLFQQPNYETQQTLERVRQLKLAKYTASLPGYVPQIEFTADELASSVPTAETLKLCESLFRRYGVLKMKNVFDKDLLADCHEAFLARYKDYLSHKRHKDALRIGDKRYQITIDIATPYDSPALAGNKLVLTLMHKVLGNSCILGCFTSAMSLPGSQDQRLHKDHKALFDGDTAVPNTPSFAVTVMVPMVDVNEHVGTTLVKKGSHRKTSKQSANMPYQTPLTEVGDCYLMDYRLSHRGQANRSNQPRPILSLVYSRPWFRDYINFAKQPPLRIDKRTFQQLPDNLKRLLEWTNEPGPGKH